MRAVAFWPDATIRFHEDGIVWDAKPRDIFWVLATQAEAEKSIVPVMGAIPVAEMQAVLKAPKEELEDSWLWPTGELSFVVPRRPSEDDSPQCFHRIYPYSGMWNGSRPWFDIGNRNNEDVPTEGVQITTIEQLDELGFNLHNRWSLQPVPSY